MKPFIYAIVIIAFIDTFSQLPIMSPFAFSLGASTAVIGFVVGMYSFSNMLGNILAGYLIDKRGAKIVLVLGLLITGIFIGFYTLVKTPEQLLMVRFLHGLSGGFLVPAAFTLISYTGKKGKQGKSMALSGAAVGISAIVGPAFGGIVANKLGLQWVFIPISIIMIVMSAVTLFLLKELKPNKLEPSKVPTNSSFIQLFQTPLLVVAYLGAFSLMFAQGALAFLLPLKVAALGFGSQFSGLLLSTFGIVAIIIFLLPTNKLFDHLKHQYVLITGMIIISIALFALSLANQMPILFIIMVLYGIGFACLFPTINALIVKSTSPSTRGKAFGLFYAFFSLGVVLGSSIIGILTLSYDSGFMIGATVLILNAIIINLLLKRSHNREQLRDIG